MNFWKSATILLTFSCIGFTSMDTDSTKLSVDNFSKLHETDSLQVRYAYQGCLGGWHHEFTFRHGSTDAVVVTSGWDDENKSFWGNLTDILNPFFPQKQPNRPDRQLGQVVLTESDLKGLDELLRYYRSSRTDGCTSTYMIKISQVRDGKTIAIEKFIDESCDLYRRVKNVMTFDAIVERLEKKKP